MKHHILTYSLMALTLLLLCSCGFGGGSKEVNGRDSLYTTDYILDLAITRPKEALALLDTAENLKIFNSFESNYLRGAVYYNGQSHYKMALLYARKAYADPEARHNPQILMSVLSLLADGCHSTGDYASSVNYCAEGLKLAQQTGNINQEANLQVTWGLNLFEMEQLDEAFNHIDLAIDILEKETHKNPCYRLWDDLCYATGMKLSLLIDKKRYDDALALRTFINKIIRGLTEAPDTPEGIIDIRRCEIDACYSYLAYTVGNKALADSLYQSVMANPYSSTSDGEYLRIISLFTTKRYDEVIHHLQRLKQYLQETTDTVNWDYIDPYLRMEYETYCKKGDWRSASRVQATMLALTDSLRKRERNEDALELAEIYKTNEQAQLIAQQTTSIQQRNIYIISSSLFLALAIIYIGHIRKVNRTIRQKNDAMVKTIDELMAYKDELFIRQGENIRLRDEVQQLQPEPEDATKDTASTCLITEKDRAIFERMNYIILNRRLYLQPNFNKKELLKEVHVPTNKFAALFKVFAGCSFKQYIQDCRLDYAVRLMREHPQWTLDAIAKEALMSNGAFYNQFQKKYGMRPSDYREKKLSEPKDESDTPALP